VTNLQVNYVTDPLGIDDTHPSLSWQLESLVNGERQTAYRILVASAADRLSPGRADVWDSGKVVSNASIGVTYGGPVLQSTRRYYWTVQAWGVHGGPSSWAARRCKWIRLQAERARNRRRLQNKPRAFGCRAPCRRESRAARSHRD